MPNTSFKYNECVDIVISRNDEVTTIELFDSWRHYTFSRCSVSSEKTRHVTDDVIFDIIKNHFSDDMSHYYICSSEHHRLTEHYEKYLSIVIAHTQEEKDELQYQTEMNEHYRWRLHIWREHYRERLHSVLTSHIDMIDKDSLMNTSLSFTTPRFYVYLEMSDDAVHWAGRCVLGLGDVPHGLSVHDFDPLPQGSWYDYLFDMIDSKYLDQHNIQYMIQKNDLSESLYDVILGFETEEERDTYFRHMYVRETGLHPLAQYMTS